MPQPQLATRKTPPSVTERTAPTRASKSTTGIDDTAIRTIAVAEVSSPTGDVQPDVATRLILRTDSGLELPLVASPAAVAPLLGKPDHGVRDDCTAGRIPTLPRGGRTGAHYRIPVARLLDELGVPYRIEPVNCSGAS
jgi:hypothetical protein